MNLFGFTIARTATLERKLQPGSLQPVPQSRTWFHWLHETSAGGWQRNEVVNVDAALTNPTLYACITRISGDIAKLRPMLVEQDNNRIWKEVDSPAFSPVLEQPNPYQNWAQYVSWYLTSKLVSGNVYVLKERDQRGVVRAVHVLDPCRVTPLIAPDTSVFYQLSPNPLVSGLPQSVVVPAREIIHDRVNPLFHPLVGISPIYAAGWPAIQGLNIRSATDRFVSNGSRPGGILTYPGTISQEKAEAMKAEWTAAFSGEHQGEVALLTAGMTYSQMGMMTAEQSRVIEQLHMTDEDIAKCFGVPRHKVGIGPDPTYTNIEAKNQDYLVDCLQVHINEFQIAHTKGLEVDRVPGKTLAIELDLDDLLLMDMAAKAEAAQKAINAGLSYNEARLRFWDAGPVDGGAAPLAQQQYYSLEALAKRDAAPPTPQPVPAVPQPDPEPAEKRLDGLRGLVRKRLERAA